VRNDGPAAIGFSAEEVVVRFPGAILEDNCQGSIGLTGPLLLIATRIARFVGFQEKKRQLVSIHYIDLIKNSRE